MRTRVASWVPALAMVVAMAACVGQTGGKMEKVAVDTGAVTATIDSLTGVFAAVVAARDTNAIVDLYSDDTRVLPANAPLAEGRDANRQLWVGFLSIPGLELDLKSSTVIVSEAGDLAVDVGAYTLRGQDPTGKPFDDAGKYVTVFKKTDGGWKIIVDTWNSDRPLPGMGS